MRKKVPKAEIILDKTAVPRGENLCGTIKINAGIEDLWLEKVSLAIGQDEVR